MDPIARIIDANANRAREALRVMEDAARFGLDDPALSGALKTLRHDLRDALAGLTAVGLNPARLLASRDTPGDVGTAISTDAETTRRGLPDIAAAAAARLTEALRAIEESAKAAAGRSADFEALRYRAYEAERRLLLALGPRNAPQWRLCVLITADLCTHHPWETVARAALSGGTDCLQLREKLLDSAELLDRARRLVAIVRDHASATGRPRAAVIINDRPDIALLAGADGVHLGQTDLPITEARKIVGSGVLIGISTSNLDQARAAIGAGADMCGIGTMFETTTKHKPELSGPAYLRAYLADDLCRQTPHLAIGGITPRNVGELWSAGCRGVAVSSVVCTATRPDVVCGDLLAGAPRT